ncbi:MAG: hypothetical protein HY900_04725 [Deltaproteobacteria bacterium]|nr:hypothetical protein [Deltaproteobacteria bacterium]
METSPHKPVSDGPSRPRSGWAPVLLCALVLLFSSGVVVFPVSATETGIDPVGQLGGATMGVDIQGRYAYAGEGPRLAVIDIADPLNIQTVARSGLLPDFVRDVVVSGNYAYAAAATGGLRILDVLDPGNPHEVGSFCPPDIDSYGVAVVGSRVYLTGNGSLHILDVSNPSAPELLSSMEFRNSSGNRYSVYNVVVEGDYAYLAARFNLVIVDVTDPTHPVQKGAYSVLPSSGRLFRGVAVAGGYAYVAANSGLLILDVSDPTHPSYVAFQSMVFGAPVPLPTNIAWARNVVVRDGWAYVAVGGGTEGVWDPRWPDTQGLWIIDVKTPAQPVVLGAFHPLGSGSDVRLVGDYAFVAMGGHSLQVMNIPNLVAQPKEPGQWYGHILLGEPGSPGVAVYAPPVGVLETLVLSGGYVYGAEGNGGLRAIDVSDPAAPRWTSTYEIVWGGEVANYYNLAVRGTLLYAPHDYRGLEVFDLSDPASLVRVAAYSWPRSSPSGAARGIAFAGNYAYVADGDNGLVVLDVTAPASPVYVSSLDTPASAYAVEVLWPYAYVADGASGLQVIDLTDAANLRIVGSLDTPGIAKAVKLSGHYAYVADGSAGLRIIDVTDPAAPSSAGSFDTPGDAQGVTISGTYAYVADNSSLLVLDVSDPSAPIQVAPAYPARMNGQFGWGVGVSGKTIFAGTGMMGLQVLHLNVNEPPVAVAGADQSVDEGTWVPLNGSASVDPDGDTLTYSWIQLAGTSVTLQASDTARPSFTAPAVPAGGETLTFQLTVSDGSATATDTVDVTVKNVNHAPVADADGPERVQEGTLVTLDGTHSYDLDDEPIAYYSWLQLSGTPVTLSDPTSASPSFSAPAEGPAGETLVFALTVSDGIENSVRPDEVSIFVENVNHPPVAKAGRDQTKNEGSLVTLNGSRSSDPDGDALAFSWRQVSGPAVPLSDESAQTPTFSAPLVGAGGAVLVFELTVTDTLGASDSDEVAVTVLNVNDPPRCDLAQSSVASLWPPNHKLLPMSIAEIADPENGQVTVEVTAVTQDEPTDGLGDGDTSPDAVLQGAQTLLRAERAGLGNGRVYRVSFTAVDSFGEGCTGAVTVCVPHDRKDDCADDGQRYDSSLP